MEEEKILFQKPIFGNAKNRNLYELSGTGTVFFSSLYIIPLFGKHENRKFI